MMNNAVVEVAGLTVVRGHVRAVDDVSFSTVPGKVTGLLGPSGCGKTTLMRSIVGVQVIEGGTVTVLGHPAGSKELRDRIGYVTQAPSVYDDLTVVENLRFFARVLGVDASEVDRCITAVDLDDRRDAVVRNLSGGQRSRASLAVALLGDPELLVLDEPTVELDPQQRLHVRELISEAAESSAVVLSTHQTEDVAALCSRVVVLRAGAVAFDGSPDALAGLAEGRVWSSDSRTPGATVAWRTGDGSHRHVGSAPPGARIVEPTLEDGYLMLLGSAALTAVAV